MKRRSITASEIENRKTPAGGFKRVTLAQWGVPWPPPKGWKSTIIQFGIPYRHKKNTHWRKDVSAHRYRGQNVDIDPDSSAPEQQTSLPAPSEAETRNKILCNKISDWIDEHSWQISVKAANELRFIIGEDLKPDPETDGVAPWD